jgi:MFS family permease
MNAANLLFVAAIVLAALSQSTALFIASRALTGLAVASNVLNPAIVGDMFVSEERGGAMSLIMLAPLLGGAVGPAVAGAVAQKVGWRYVIWMSAGLAGVCEVLFLTCFRETYEVTILKRRAASLRWKTGNVSLRTVYDDDGDRGLKKLGDDVLRPAIVLLDSGVLQALSLFGSVAFAYFYVMSVTLPDILEDIYKLSPALTGVSFISFSNSPHETDKANANV